MKHNRIVPFVDHEIGYKLLGVLVEYHQNDDIEIPVVITTLENQSGWWPKVSEICSKADIPLLIYEPSLAEQSLLESIDWYLLLSWKYILPPSILCLPNQGSINLHYSLLPKYRGVYPVNWAIINGDDTTGFTFHIVNEKIDDGDIIMQVKVPVFPSDTARSLQLRIDDKVVEHFEDLIALILEAKSIQNVRLMAITQAANDTYFSRKDFEKVCEIDLSKTYKGFEFFNLIRGLTFFEEFPNAYILDCKTKERVYISIRLKDE